jgi:hypothetical protein
MRRLGRAFRKGAANWRRKHKPSKKHRARIGARRFASAVHVSRKRPWSMEMRDGKSTGQRRLEAAGEAILQRFSASGMHESCSFDGASWLPSAVRVRAVHEQPNQRAIHSPFRPR